jgi:hypothetical protein
MMSRIPLYCCLLLLLALSRLSLQHLFVDVVADDELLKVLFILFLL